jgi:hypothetical protein
MPSRKSEVFAYLLWITTGLFGAHHFYMGHDEKAFLWLVSFGALPTGHPVANPPTAGAIFPQADVGWHGSGTRGEFRSTSSGSTWMRRRKRRR